MIISLVLIPFSSLLVDLIFGDPPNRFHPICFLSRWARLLEDKTRQLWGGTFIAGMVATLGTIAIAQLAITIVFLPWTLFPHLCYDWIPAILLIGLCMAPRGLALHARRVARALESASGSLDSARQAVSQIVGRDTSKLDAHGIARACIESVAENLTDGVLSTLFWCSLGAILAGAQGAASFAVLHRTCNTLDALWGKRNDLYRHFGTFAARCDDVLNYLPARLSLPIISLATLLLPRASSLKALRVGWKFRHAHASPNSAWSEAAFAGALDLTLGGPVSYKGLDAPYPWFGIGRLDASTQDIRRSISLMWMSTLLTTATCTLIIFLSQFI
jgi:adenosylcobinamide-phosphate synthase